jgi:hypothetical protein
MISYPKSLDFSVEDTKLPPEHPVQIQWKKQFLRSSRGLADLFRSKSLRKGIINFSLFDGIFKSIKDYLQPIIEQMALALPVLLSLDGDQRSALLIGIVYTILFLMTSFASRSAGKLKERVQQTERGLNVLFSIGAFLIIATAAAYLFDQHIIAIITFIIYYMIQNLRRPLAVEYISDRVKGSVMATGLSGESQLKAAVTALSAPVFGFFVDRRGLGEAMLGFGVLLLIFSLVYTLKSPLDKKQ